MCLLQDFYDTMDVGYKCKDGYVTVLSRADDVINVAGHRISAGAIEEVGICLRKQYFFHIFFFLTFCFAKVILECVDLADCAVVARSDQLKGDVPFAFICLRKDSNATERELTEKLVRSVRNSIGPVASFKHLVIVKRLPKTRSGKIARNCLKAMLNNQTYKAPVTIEDNTVFDEIKEALLQKGFENITSPSN
jgi:propionyl-CoA synthetase